MRNAVRVTIVAERPVIASRLRALADQIDHQPIELLQSYHDDGTIRSYTSEVTHVEPSKISL